MADELARLAVEVEGATDDPDTLRHLDYRVMLAILPAGRGYLWDPNGASHRYTTSLDAVVALIHERLPGLSYEVHESGLGGAWARLHDPMRQPGFGADLPRADGKSASLALLAATLRAIASQEKADA